MNLRERSSPVVTGALFAGRYRIEEKLGKGGMGVVLAAYDEVAGIRVAIKLMDDMWISDETLVARFVREATAASQIDSMHVARVNGHGRLEDGRPYIVSEFLEGFDLAHYMMRTNVPVEEVVDFVCQACRGLEAVHRAGIIHRDLKPANLFLSHAPNGVQIVKVLDFGICKLRDRKSGNSLTRESDVMGTPRYMPPEQLASTRDVDVRADVWAMGVILYEILTGRAPFPGNHIMELTEAIVGKEPVPIRSYRPDVPPGLASVIDRCLVKNREGRYPSAAALEQALAPFGSDAPAQSQIETQHRMAEPRPPTMKLDDSGEPPPSVEHVTMPSGEVDFQKPAARKTPAPSVAAPVPPVTPSGNLVLRAGDFRRFGRYLIYKPLASGGMASVFYGVARADDGALTSVAIKQVRSDVSSQERVTMLADEARIVGSIRHPNVVGILDVIVEKGSVMLAMPLIIGSSLQQVRRAAEAAQRPFPPAIASAIIVDVLAGIHAAHEARDRFGQPLDIVHRDISPHNILVDVTGVSLVTDFGVAFARGRLQRSTETGTLKGKVGYLAPEQIHGKPTQATDLYAAGACFWELLTGEPLFEGSEAEMLAAALLGRIDPPSKRLPGLPPALDAVLLRSLARTPEERFRSGQEMADAIAQAVPVAPREEVAAWLREMTGPAITEQQATLEAMMRAVVQQNAFDDPGFATDATSFDVASNPGATPPLAMGSASVAVAPRRSWTIRRAAALIGALFAIGGGMYALGVSRAQQPRPLPPVATTPSTVTVVTPPASASALPASSVEPDDTAIEVEEPHGPAVDGGARPPKKRLPAPKKSPDCSTPYTIDSSGRTVWRRECFKK